MNVHPKYGDKNYMEERIYDTEFFNNEYKNKKGMSKPYIGVTQCDLM